MGNELIMVGGDWNVALEPRIDTNHPNNTYRNRSRRVLQNFMEQNDVVDIFRSLHPNCRKYSWRRFNGVQRSRIDYFLTSEQLALSIHTSDIIQGYNSDHSLVFVSFQTDIVKRHRPLWKFNNSLLKDIDFVNIVKTVILDVKKTYAALVYDRDTIHLIDDEDLVLTIDDQLFLEMILLEIRGKCISYSSFKKKQLVRKENEILSEIKQLEEHLTNDNVIRLEQRRQDLMDLRRKKVDGMIIRSRSRWIGDGEKNSKYFCSLEKRNFVQKAMCTLQKDSGEVIHNSDQITQETKTFYEKLYSSRERELLNEDIDNNLIHPKLTNEQRDNIEGKIGLEELTKAVKHLKNDKSPGSDGYNC